VENRSSSTHKQLSKCLIDSKYQDIRDLGIKLRCLHKQRADCDYKLEVKLIKTEAPLAIMMSESLMESFSLACKALKN